MVFWFFLQAGNIQTLHLDLSPGSAWSLTSWHFHGTPRPPPALCAPLSVLGGGSARRDFNAFTKPRLRAAPVSCGIVHGLLQLPYRCQRRLPTKSGRVAPLPASKLASGKWGVLAAGEVRGEGKRKS